MRYVGLCNLPEKNSNLLHSTSVKQSKPENLNATVVQRPLACLKRGVRLLRLKKIRKIEYYEVNGSIDLHINQYACSDVGLKFQTLVKLYKLVKLINIP